MMKQYFARLFSRLIKFCPKTGRPVKALKKWIIPIFSILSIIWILIRLIPKPQRATYPCMKIAIPFASSFLLYISSFIASVLLFKKAFRKISETKFLFAGVLLLFGFVFTITTILINKNISIASVLSANEDYYNYEDPLGPNKPIGEAKGILPGRVVWVHNPDATNEDCIPYNFGNGYFMEKNADQNIIDEMLKTAMLDVTGATTEEEAWDFVFKYFNITHNKGDIGYVQGEKIFIKINAVHAWNTKDDLSILFDDDYGNVDTSPQAILAVLRQLINKAGVPQEAIYLGDPYTNIFKHLYAKLSTEFPNIHYMSQGDYENREKLQKTNTETIQFSDKGTVLDVLTDSFYDCTINADYVLNIPAIKGHRGGGVTLFAKNHFGTNTQQSAAHMHKGNVLVNRELRGEYKSYRVFVDLMAYEHLGGKTLIYIGDFLWGTSMEHDPPIKFLSEPFNNDWSSSILVSLDPVAISSVALDILQEEFQEEVDLDSKTPRWKHVHFTGVDDYLHQAASSDWWPDGITYDPEGDGTPIGSLGVHEHWNNATDKQYSRNLGTGNGIELLYKNTKGTSSTIGDKLTDNVEFKVYLSNASSILNIEVNADIQEAFNIKIYNIAGQLMQQDKLESIDAHENQQIPLDKYSKGQYVVVMQTKVKQFSQMIIIN